VLATFVTQGFKISYRTLNYVSVRGRGNVRLGVKVSLLMTTTSTVGINIQNAAKVFGGPGIRIIYAATVILKSASLRPGSNECHRHWAANDS